jgi:hypothetical protein
MPSGGHARSGPPSDPNSLSNGTGTGSGAWIHLTVPTEPAPAWPLGEPTDAEAALWLDLWSRPPASVWPRFFLTREVATYVRTLLAFENGGHRNAALGALVQRLADQLGLTVAGAHRNRWAYPDPARTRPATVHALPGGRASVRDRLADQGIHVNAPQRPRSSAKDRHRQIPAGSADPAPF